MFRLREQGMPVDPAYPSDLRQLGYFINAESNVKQIQPPHDFFIYKISNNERVNDVYREAMNECIRKEIVQRMAALGMPPLYLPHFTYTKPNSQPNVPILLSSKNDLRKKKRVIVVINDDNQDLGVFAYRHIMREEGIEAGSVIALAKAMQIRQLDHIDKITHDTARLQLGHKDDNAQDAVQPPQREAEDAVPASTSGASQEPIDTTTVPFKRPETWEVPGLVVLNPGQLLYSHLENKAMTNTSWDAKPRPSSVHQQSPVNPEFNKTKGHESVLEHVKSVFDSILADEDWVASDAELYVIGLRCGGDAVVQLLSNEWPKYKGRVKAILLADPTPIQDPIDDQDFVSFLRHRGRALVISPEPLSTPIAVPSIAGDHHKANKARLRPNIHESGMSKSPWLEEIARASSVEHNSGDGVVSGATEPAYSNEWGYHYFPMLSSGAPTFGDTILPTTYRQILAWFETVAADPSNYYNPVFKVPVKGLEDADIFDVTVE
ncbi:uncharacterized protein K452DRAFT_355671 [Aplosporella prunicola CBS 121167]|uniref:Arb2 domain-containing protein n=1 Tax=Aplosporella prunicola CBS 121167 TaxID=1176127 RepID=A0A6A6BTU4_9PEZI|nr:uncharacterized protein K452DRAFT_355671 [Aplosporella prunicola CBS 121167]KAF2146247.1 hypothetical protein K452DRAFT_355671 [Aplosporella prunicola CBS 121167]